MGMEKVRSEIRVKKVFNHFVVVGNSWRLTWNFIPGYSGSTLSRLPYEIALE